MKRENIIHMSKLFCSLLILLVLAIFAWATNISSQNPSELKLPSIEKMDQFYKDMLQLKETTIQQRNEIITKLMNVVKDTNYPNTTAAIFTAVNILGKIRAVEAADLLLDMADYRGKGSSQTYMIRIPTKAPPDELERDWPFVKALINIKPPFESIMKRLRDENNTVNYYCYVAILAGTEGPDISRYLLENAIKKETDIRKLARLNDALKILNESYPKDSNDVKQK
jgi:hypothetical protein